MELTEEKTQEQLEELKETYTRSNSWEQIWEDFKKEVIHLATKDYPNKS